MRGQGERRDSEQPEAANLSAWIIAGQSHAWTGCHSDNESLLSTLFFHFFDFTKNSKFLPPASL